MSINSNHFSNAPVFAAQVRESIGRVEPSKPSSGERVRAYINDTYTGMSRPEIEETANQGLRFMTRDESSWRVELDRWVAARTRVPTDDEITEAVRTR